jgi:hypothetical protein
MIIRIFIFGILSFFVTTTLAKVKKISLTGKEKITLLSTRETKNCFVSYINIDGVMYLIKQKKDSKKQLSVVRDALAAEIAQCLKIAHEIVIVPFKSVIPGKKNSSWPATLHTIAPGETVRAQKNKYSAIRLRQFWAGAKNFQEKGLTRAIITFMTWHDQLPVIVALDLIIGNSDRHCGNICYDPITDTFCAIDMDDTFNKDLCAVACKKIKMMIKDENVIFTKAELKALRIMKNTLQLLVDEHNPKDIIAKLHVFIKRAGFVKGNKIYTNNIVNKIHLYEEMILNTHESAHKLIALLNKIIKQKSVKITDELE